jgi:hypothetical protein
MLTRLLSTLATVFVALTLAPAALADVGDSAIGEVVVSDAWAGDTLLSFAAMGGAGDSGTGTMQITYTATGLAFAASADCLFVAGNEAVIVGTVTAAPSPDVVGARQIFYVVDHETPGVGSDLIETDGVRERGASTDGEEADAKRGPGAPRRGGRDQGEGRLRLTVNLELARKTGVRRPNSRGD